MAEVETSTRGRCAAGSALTASTTARVAATLERLISALCAAVHRVAMGSPTGCERWLWGNSWLLKERSQAPLPNILSTAQLLL